MALLTGALQGLEKTLQGAIQFEMRERERDSDNYWRKMSHGLQEKSHGLQEKSQSDLQAHRAESIGLQKENLELSGERLTLEQQNAEYQRQIAESRESREAEMYSIKSPFISTGLQLEQDLLKNRLKLGDQTYTQNESQFPLEQQYLTSQIDRQEYDMGQSKQMDPLRQTYLENQISAQGRQEQRDALEQQYLTGQIDRQTYELEQNKLMDPLRERYIKSQIGSLDQSTRHQSQRHPYEINNLELSGQEIASRIAARQAIGDTIKSLSPGERAAVANESLRVATSLNAKRHKFGPNAAFTKEEHYGRLQKMSHDLYNRYLGITGNPNSARRILTYIWTQALNDEDVQKSIRRLAKHDELRWGMEVDLGNNFINGYTIYKPDETATTAVNEIGKGVIKGGEYKRPNEDRYGKPGMLNPSIFDPVY